MQDPLIPVSELMPLKAELRRRIAALAPPIPFALTEELGAEALAWSLLFEHWTDLLPEHELDRERALYNRYFWFRRFATQCQAARGHDAGLEQRLFQMIEYPGFDVDWDLLERIDTRAKEGLVP